MYIYNKGMLLSSDRRGFLRVIQLTAAGTDVCGASTIVNSRLNKRAEPKTICAILALKCPAHLGDG